MLENRCFYLHYHFCFFDNCKSIKRKYLQNAVHWKTALIYLFWQQTIESVSEVMQKGLDGWGINQEKSNNRRMTKKIHLFKKHLYHLHKQVFMSTGTNKSGFLLIPTHCYNSSYLPHPVLPPWPAVSRCLTGITTWQLLPYPNPFF